MIRSILSAATLLIACNGPLEAATVGHTFTGKTYFYNVVGFENEYPLGSTWELRVEWDDAASSTFLSSTQAGYPLTKFTFTIHGNSGAWTTSSLAGKPSFTLNKNGLLHEIQFTSGWGPENHTNGTIQSGQTFSINLILGDPTGNALPTLSPVPGAIDPSAWSADKSKSYLKFYLTDTGKAIYGEVDGLGETVDPPAPEIAIKLGGKALKDGKTTVRFDDTKVGRKGQTQTFTILNTGKAPLTGLSISKGGKHKGDFLTGSLSKTSIAPGGKATFVATFKPKAAGTRKCVLKVASNDGDENPFLIPLVGTGK